MRKLITWIVVSVGIAALVKRLKRRGVEPEPAQADQPTDDPAEELRHKLAESRTTEEPPEPPEPSAAPPEASVEERRADVHDQGRAALDEMTPSDES
jgi:hypothetical protein